MKRNEILGIDVSTHTFSIEALSDRTSARKGTKSDKVFLFLSEMRSDVVRKQVERCLKVRRVDSR